MKIIILDSLGSLLDSNIVEVEDNDKVLEVAREMEKFKKEHEMTLDEFHKKCMENKDILGSLILPVVERS